MPNHDREFDPDYLKWLLRRAHRRASDKRDPELEKIMNADLLTWSRYFLPHHFTLPPSAMHIWLAQQLDRISGIQPRQ
jgi:hypothetical protein